MIMNIATVDAIESLVGRSSIDLMLSAHIIFTIKERVPKAIVQPLSQGALLTNLVFILA